MKSVGELALSMSQKDKLLQAGVTTMGQLEDLRAGKYPEYPQGLNSIKGFGEKAITEIENMILEWLRVSGPKVEGASGEVS